MIGSRARQTAPAIAGMTPPIAPLDGVDVPITAVNPAALASRAAASLPDFSHRIDPTTGQPQWHSPGMAGAGQRFGEWLHAPGTAGALLRGAAASFNGDGLGGAIQAGAGYMDQQKSAAAHAHQQEFENSMAVLKQAVDQQQANNTGDYQQGTLRNDAFRVGETMRHNAAGEAIDANGQRIQIYNTDTSAATARRGQDVQVQTTGMNNATSTANNSADNVTSRANNTATVGASMYGDDSRAYLAGLKPAGIGSSYTETATKVLGKPAVNHWFGPDDPAIPATTTTVRTPAPTGGNEVRYDAHGNAFRKGPDGRPVRVQ